MTGDEMEQKCREIIQENCTEDSEGVLYLDAIPNAAKAVAAFTLSQVQAARENVLDEITRVILAFRGEPIGRVACCRIIEEFRALKAQGDPEPPRCKHGVWAADHCWDCAFPGAEPPKEKQA